MQAARQVTVEDDMMYSVGREQFNTLPFSELFCAMQTNAASVQFNRVVQWREELVVWSVIALNLNWPKRKILPLAGKQDLEI